MEIFSEEYQRRFKRHCYQTNPWISLPALVTAIVLTIIYRPPTGAVLVMLAAGSAAGVAHAYGPLSKHQWLEKTGFSIVLLSALSVVRSYSLKIDGPYYAVIAWMAFGMLGAFWFWRKRGMETYGSPVPPKVG